MKSILWIHSQLQQLLVLVLLIGLSFAGGSIFTLWKLTTNIDSACMTYTQGKQLLQGTQQTIDNLNPFN